MSDTSTIAGRLRPLGFSRYADYLKSGHWQELKRRYAASDLPQGCECGAEAVALHHATYERLGHELLTDLVPVCDSCHRKLHGKRPRRPRRKFPRGVTVRHDPSIVRVQKP